MGFRAEPGSQRLWVGRAIENLTGLDGPPFVLMLTMFFDFHACIAVGIFGLCPSPVAVGAVLAATMFAINFLISRIFFNILEVTMKHVQHAVSAIRTRSSLDKLSSLASRRKTFGLFSTGLVVALLLGTLGAPTGALIC